MDRKALAENIFIRAVAGSNELTGPVLDPSALESIAHKSLAAAKVFERVWQASVGLTAKTDQGGGFSIAGTLHSGIGMADEDLLKGDNCVIDYQTGRLRKYRKP